MASIDWNIIIRNIHADDQMRKEIRQKLAGLEKHIIVFCPDKLHLQVLLERHLNKPLYTVELTLRLPADILRSERAAPDLMTAFDDALQILVAGLESGKGGRQRGALSKRNLGGEPAQAPESVGFAAEAQSQDAGPQNLQDVIREFFQQNYRRLLYHARRHIRHEEMTGDIPAGALDGRDIVDEVARQVEAKASRKPKKMSWRVWLFHLLHEELRRQRERLKQEQAEAIPTEKQTMVPESQPKALQPMEEMVEKVLEPQVIRTEDVVPNPEAVPPDRILEEKELLEHLQGTVQSWPRSERETFELYFVQGFEPDEIARIKGQPVKQVKEELASLQRRLREELLQEEALIAA